MLAAICQETGTWMKAMRSSSFSTASMLVSLMLMISSMASKLTSGTVWLEVCLGGAFPGAEGDTLGLAPPLPGTCQASKACHPKPSANP